MTEGSPDKNEVFCFQEALETTPHLKEFVTELRGEFEQAQQEFPEQDLVRLFSKMNTNLKRETWVDWLNREVPFLDGVKPRELLVTGRIDEVEACMDRLSDGVYR